MKRILIVLMIVVSAVAAGAGWWVLRPSRTTFLTDAETIREPAETVSLREVLWQPPAPVQSVVDEQSDEIEPRLTADGATLFFVRGKPGHNAEIFVCTREGDAWGSPRPLVEVNSNDDDLGPAPSADGRSLYFYSDRSGSVGGYDLWVARKTDDGWTAPTNLGSAVNTAYNEYGPAVSPDGRSLCFSSNRPKPGEAPPSDEAWRATIREDLYRHDYDLYAAAITDAGFRPAMSIDAVNSPNNDGAPAFSPIGDFLYFSSDRTGGSGGFDLYRARIIRGTFQPPINLGGAVNTRANELDPAIDVGGYELHFSSDRVVNGAEPSSNSPPPRYHLYRTFSREVFRDVEVREPVIQWAALWKQIGPNVMWAILALLVFGLLLALMRDVHRRRLSLFARCLIISLMVHSLIMLWFNTMKVTATVAAAVRRSGPIRVALSPGGRSGDLSLQIRGGLTHADAPPASLPKLDRASPSVAPTISAVRVEVPIEKAAAPREVSSIRFQAVDASPTPAAMPLARSVPAADVPLASAEYALPVESSRSNSPEKSDAGPPVAAAMKIGHHYVPAPTSRPAVETQRVDLSAEITGDGGPVFESVARGGPLTDARPASNMSHLMQSGLAAAVFGTSPDTEVSLPVTTEDIPRQSNGETAMLPTVAVDDPTRTLRPMLTLLETRGGAIQQIRPEGSGIATSQPILVAIRGIGSHDAQPGFGAAIAGMAGSSIGLGTPFSLGSGKGNSSGIDVELPSDGHGQRVSASEEGPGPGGLVTSGASTIPSRMGYSFVGGTGHTTAFEMAAGTSQPGPPGGESLVAGGSLIGGDRFGGGGDGETSGRNLIGNGPSGLPSTSSIPIATDPSAVALELPDETTPAPNEQVAAIPMKPTAPIGRINGRVYDYSTGERLADARIQLDLPGGGAIVVASDTAGRYEMAVPEMPDYFAVSASKSGYRPKTRNVAHRAVAGRSMRLNFTLRPESLQVVALEDSPIVHHLGNDAYQGRINSQFQREAEGRRYTFEFNLSAGQLVAGQAEVELLAKGVQCPHKIAVNGRFLDDRLDESPEDGSFGVFVAAFDAEWLQAGANTLEIRAVSCNGDLDDFEFINPQIRLHARSH